ncbi:MAG: hypothetical protein ACR2LR_17820 [Hassallia sp.]
MNNFTKGLLLFLAITAPVAITAQSSQAMTPKTVPAVKSTKVQETGMHKNTHRTGMHKRHYHRATKAHK